MKTIFVLIDDLLRARSADAVEQLPRDGGPAPAKAPSLILYLVAILLLGALYGAAMGLFGLLDRLDSPYASQVALGFGATMLKVPMLFVLSLVVTLPSLYVAATMADSRLGWSATVALLLRSNTVATILLASLAPIMVFFTFSTDSYPFIVLLNVVFFVVATQVGMSQLRRTLDVAFDRQEEAKPPAATSAEDDFPSPPDEVTPLESPAHASESAFVDSPARKLVSTLESASVRNTYVGEAAQRRLRAVQAPPARTVFKSWTWVYYIVIAQMAWVLRPFIGDPNQPFTMFRPREGTVFGGIFKAIALLFGV